MSVTPKPLQGAALEELPPQGNGGDQDRQHAGRRACSAISIPWSRPTSAGARASAHRVAVGFGIELEGELEVPAASASLPSASLPWASLLTVWPAASFVDDGAGHDVAHRLEVAALRGWGGEERDRRARRLGERLLDLEPHAQCLGGVRERRVLALVDRVARPFAVPLGSLPSRSRGRSGADRAQEVTGSRLKVHAGQLMWLVLPWARPRLLITTVSFAVVVLMTVLMMFSVMSRPAAAVVSRSTLACDDAPV